MSPDSYRELCELIEPLVAPIGISPKQPLPADSPVLKHVDAPDTDNIRFFDVSPLLGKPSSVLNELGRAGLLDLDGVPSSAQPLVVKSEAPRLRLVGGIRIDGSMTFEDLNEA